MQTKIKQLAYLCSGLFLSFILAGVVAAQTAGTMTSWTCPDGSTGTMSNPCPMTSGSGTTGAGSTTMTTCPNGTQVPMGSTCPSTMTTCPDGSQVATGTTCPTAESKCTSGSPAGKWCKNSDGATGYCSYSTTPCPAYDSASCKSQNGDWCTYTSGTGGWCATNGATCPINDEASCTAKSRSWCKPATGNTMGGWCASVGQQCPANDESSCKTQGGEWCTTAAGSAAGSSQPWCQTSGGCPVNDKASCETKSRLWCPYTSGTGGWCASTGYKCDGTTTGTATYKCTDGTMVSDSSKCPSNFTCTDGSKVSDSSKCPSTTNVYMSWPQSQAECTKYKGVWCLPSGNTSGMSYGSCMMAGQSCPKQSTSNMMTCWDNSQVAMGTSCPTTPMNQSDCSTKGGVWCNSGATGGSGTSAVSSGWCSSPGSICTKMPPAGKMTCPDNQTFASKLTECPVTDVQPDINYKTCPDGTLVKKDTECPKQVINYTICPDGTKVVEGTKCPETKDNAQITACLAKSALWCVQQESGKPGYCSTTGACQQTVDDKDKVKKDDQKEKDRLVLTEKEIKKIEQTKKNFSSKLETLEKFFTKINDTASVAKITTLKSTLASLPQDTSALDALGLISDDIDTLKSIKDDYISNNTNTSSEQDQELQKIALQKLKKNVSKFANQLSVIQARIAKLESAGATVSGEVKDMVLKAQDLVKQIQNANSFDEARDSAESLRDLADDLNSAMATIEQLTRIQGLTKIIDKEISKREAGLRRAQTLAKKFKVDVGSLLDEVGTLVNDTRESFDNAKKAEFGDSEPIEFVQTNIIDKLDDIDTKLANLQALTNLKGGLKQVSGQITKYDTQIKRFERKKKDVTEMKSLLADVKEHYATLQSLGQQKITDENLSAIVDELSTIADLTGQLDDLLQLNAPSALEKALKQGLKSNESLKGIDIPSLETSLIRAYRVATFIRRTPDQTAAYITVGGPRKINTTRGAFAQDQ